MTNYNFPKNLYPENISYKHSRYVFIFFTTKEQTKEFFKFLFYRLNEEYKKRKSGDKVCPHLLRNNNNRAPLIDINYNFFIEVLAEWIEHYCFDKNEITEYRRFVSVDGKDMNDNTIRVTKYRDYKINLTVKEKVLFDYSYSGWRVSSNYHKNVRYDFAQVLMNNILGKHTYVTSYQYRKNAKVVNIRLVKDLQSGDYIKYAALSFVRITLENYYSTEQMKKLHDMSDECEILSSDYKGIQKKIESLGLTDDMIQHCNVFDMLSIEKTRDEGDGILHLFEKNKKLPDGPEEQIIPDDVPDLEDLYKV